MELEQHGPQAKYCIAVAKDIYDERNNNYEASEDEFPHIE